MKKRRLVFTSLILGLVFIVSACGQVSHNDGSAEKVLKVGVTGQSYPNSYKEGGKLVGFDVEVVESIARELGYRVDWVMTDFSGLMGQLDSGKVDTVANAVAKTTVRARKFGFTAGYSYYGAQLVAEAKNVGINNVEDFKGRKVAGVLGSNHIDNLKHYDMNGDIVVKTYETRDGAMQDLLKGGVDGYINSRPVLLAELRKKNLPLKLVGNPIAYEEVGFPFAKNEKGGRLQRAFTEQLESLHKTGTLKRLSEKYFGEDITIMNK